MPSRSDLLDELLRLTQAYKADDGRRRVPMLEAAQMAQPAGNAFALPETPQSGPDLDEFSYLGKPSPPVEGGPGMPAFSERGPNPYATIVLPGMFAGGPDVAAEPTVLGGGRVMGIPPGFSITDDPTVPIRDPVGEPARYAYPRMSEVIADIGRQILPVAGGTLPTLARGAVGGAVGTNAATGFVTGAGPTLPGTWYHPLSENKLRRPVEEMSATRVPTQELAPRKVVTPSDLQGEVMIPLVGDRAATGQRLTAVNEQPLAHPVELQGGPDYMRSVPGALWASNKSAAGGFQSRVNKLAEMYGQSPLAVFTAQNQRGGDYAHHVADTLIGMMPDQKISQKNRSAFKTAMKDRGYPIPGVTEKDLPALREQMLRPESGRAREAFVQEMAAKPWQDARFPDVASARAATIEPAILHDPAYSGGYAIGRTAPGQATGASPSRHITYTTQIPGEAVGGLEFPLPKEKMFFDWWRERQAKGHGLDAMSDYAFRLALPPQKATQEWVDQAEEYLRRRREGTQSR